MDERSPHVTPELARAQLEHAASTRITGDRDRWIHGFSTVALGVLLSAYVAGSSLTESFWSDAAVIWGCGLLASLLWSWQAHALTAPRHAKVAAAVGFAAWFVLVPFVESWPATALPGVPLVLAGTWILVRR